MVSTKASKEDYLYRFDAYSRVKTSVSILTVSSRAMLIKGKVRWVGTYESYYNGLITDLGLT